MCLIKILHRFGLDILLLYVNVWCLYIIDFILVTSEESNQVVRSDGRCGPTVPQSDGSPSECNPETEFFCCSKWGYCGSTDEHCDCADCVNYRKSSKGILHPFFVSIYTRLHVSIQEDILITYEFIITYCHHMQTQVQLKTRKNISLRQYDNFIVYNTLIFVDYNINMVMRSLDSNH